MANRAKEWSNFRQPEASPLPRNGSNGHQKKFTHQSDTYPHNCGTRACALQNPYLPDGSPHFPHCVDHQPGENGKLHAARCRSAVCHHPGEDPSRCSVHGTFLQFYGGPEYSKRYPAGVCYDCLPPHRPDCPILMTGQWNTCMCPERLEALGVRRYGRGGRRKRGYLVQAAS